MSSDKDFVNVPPRKKFFKTCLCEKQFSAKTSFYAHLKSCLVAKSKAKNQPPKKKYFKICKCKKEFDSRHFYNAHLKNCPVKRETPAGNFICLEENCSFRATVSDDLLNHLKDIHNKKPVEDVKKFQNYSDFKNWLQNFEKEDGSSFIRKTNSSESKKTTEYYYCNRGGKYLSKSTGKRRSKSQGSRKIGFSCPASIRAVVETSLVTVKIKALHYGHQLDLCHINLPKNEKIKMADQLLQGVQPKQLLKNIRDISSTKLERKHLCTRQDLKNIKKSYGINVEKKHVEDDLSDDLYDEDTTDEDTTDTTDEDEDAAVLLENTNNQVQFETVCTSMKNVEVKDELMLKISQIQELIKTCNSRDLLLASRQHINKALNVLNISHLKMGKK